MDHIHSHSCFRGISNFSGSPSSCLHHACTAPLVHTKSLAFHQLQPRPQEKSLRKVLLLLRLFCVYKRACGTLGCWAKERYKEATNKLLLSILEWLIHLFSYISLHPGVSYHVLAPNIPLESGCWWVSWSAMEINQAPPRREYFCLTPQLQSHTSGVPETPFISPESLH